MSGPMTRSPILLSLLLALSGCPMDSEMPDAGTDAGRDAPLPPVDAGPESELAAGDVTDPLCGTYHVTGSITVPAGETVTVCAGSVLRFESGASMTVAGTLALEGTSAARIRLMSDDTWAGLVVDGSVDATFVDLLDATSGVRGNDGSSIAFEDASIVAASPSATTIRLANGGRFDRSQLIGGGTIYVTGGIWEMTDSVVDQMHPPTTPDCTDWAGGGAVFDHVRITGCHCPIHFNSTDETVTLTNSIFDGATNPIMIANTVATITHNHFIGTGTLVLDIGRRDDPQVDADVSDNYWDGGEPNIGTTTRSQFTGTDDFSMTPFTDVGPR